jgi:NAD-dependent deacetylase
VHRFYSARRQQAARATPNAAHRALAELEQRWPGDVVIVTQNVDPLHEAAGSRNVLHMHGTLAGALCAACDHRWPAPQEMTTDTTCPACHAPRSRPDVVWFGEVPYHLDEIGDHLTEASLFAAIGTSGQVQPAASFVQEAASGGAKTIELNLAPSDISDAFDERRFGPATEVVPDWVRALLHHGPE